MPQPTTDQIASGTLFGKAPEEATVQAYLNYLLFDDDFILQDFGYAKLSTAALEDDSVVRVEQPDKLRIYN